jgi:hypothetical protein
VERIGSFLVWGGLASCIFLFLTEPGWAADGVLQREGGNPPPAPGKSAFCILLLLLGLMMKTAKVAAALAIQALYPARVVRVGERMATQPGKMLLIGMVDLVFATAILIVLGEFGKKVPLFSLFALLFFVALLGALFLGLAGVYAAVGRRLAVPQSEVSPAGALLRGGAVVELATLFPLIGWLTEAVLACMALGAGILVLFEKPVASSPIGERPDADNTEILPDLGEEK